MSQTPRFGMVAAALLCCAGAVDALTGSTVKNVKTAMGQPGSTVGVKKVDSQLDAAAQPKKFALVIGIDNYGRDPLQGCVKDAERFRNALVEHSGFLQSNVTLLLDKAATYNAILNGIVVQYRKAQRGDLFVFYYSGHGTLFPDEKSADRDEKNFLEPPKGTPGRYDGAICPVDVGSGVNSSNMPWENLVLDDTLAWHFSRFTSKGCTVIFISDSCFSAAQARGSDDDEILPKTLDLTKTLRSLPNAGENRNAEPKLPEQIKQDLKLIPTPAISREVRAYNLRGQYLLFAASRDIQTSGATKNGSLFTNTLLDVMRKRPGATYNEIYKEVAARVTALSKSKNMLQEPRLDRTYYMGSLDETFLGLPKLPESISPTELKVVVKVLNQQGETIKDAKVAILPLQEQETTPVASGATSNSGVFETTIPIKVGDYRLRVESSGSTKVEGVIDLVESRTAGTASFTVRLDKL